MGRGAGLRAAVPIALCRKFAEEPWQVFGALRVEGATLAGAELRGNRICYTLSSIERARTPGGFLTESWLRRDNRVRTLTGARLAGDGVDYGVEDGGQADVVHETEAWVLDSLDGDLRDTLDEFLARVMTPGPDAHTR